MMTWVEAVGASVVDPSQRASIWRRLQSSRMRRPAASRPSRPAPASGKGAFHRARLARTLKEDPAAAVHWRWMSAPWPRGGYETIMLACSTTQSPAARIPQREESLLFFIVAAGVRVRLAGRDGKVKSPRLILKSACRQIGLAHNLMAVRATHLLSRIIHA